LYNINQFFHINTYTGGITKNGGIKESTLLIENKIAAAEKRSYARSCEEIH